MRSPAFQRANLTRQLAGGLAMLRASAARPHRIWLVEYAALSLPDPTTGLPVVSGGPVLTEITPTPMILLGGKLIDVGGGALTRLGDLEVTEIDRASWPAARLLAAQGFYLDAPAGELYQVVNDTLKEYGTTSYTLCLARMSTRP